MDTHIAPSPDSNHHNIAVTARLPGEPDPDDRLPLGGGDRERRENPATQATLKKRRVTLFGGAAVAGVVVVAGAAFMLSHDNHVVRLPAKVASTVHQLPNQAGIKLNGPLAPSASLASVAVLNRPNVVMLPKYVPKPREQDLSEILGMRPGAQAQHTQNAGAFEPHEPGSALAPANSAAALVAPKVSGYDVYHDITQSVIAALDVKPPGQRVPLPTSLHAPLKQNDAVPQPAATAVLPPEPAALLALPTIDAVKQALNLQAAPMATGDQIKVLDLVTQMATEMRDLKAENANLRADFAKTSAEDQTRLADFARRVGFAEASKAVAAANSEGQLGQVFDESRAPRALLRPAMAFAPIAVTRPQGALPSSAPQEATHYRVQAASPGLALLTEVARGGGEGAQLQVTVGEAIPGWGRVNSVAQRGTSWVVSTEHGIIE